MSDIPRIHLFLPGAIFVIPQPESKTVYLTFDDGPDPDTTPQIVEILAKYDCHATFFVVGERIKQYPEIGKMIVDSGHIVGNHLLFHSGISFLSPACFLQQIQTTQQIIESITNQPCPYFRPPYGRILPGTISRLRQQGVYVVLWNVFVPDYRPGFHMVNIIRRVQHLTKPGAIILLHDFSLNVKETIQALPAILQDLKDRGLQSSRLPQPDSLYHINKVHRAASA